ncbi:unnamed protein product [Lampetra planeri]
MEALRVLPTALDDNALTAFDAILSEHKSMLPQTLVQMEEIFAPPSNKCQKFSTRRRGEAKTPLAFRSGLMALAKSAYPGMDHVRRDSLVLERMLMLAQGLKVVMPATGEDDLSSLQVAWCLQAHLDIQQRATVAACTGPPEGSGAPEDVEPLQACASLDGTKWMTGFRCGLPEHVLMRCHIQRGRPFTMPPSSARPSFTPLGPQFRMANASVQVLAMWTVKVPPGAQMLIPLRRRKQLYWETTA